MKNSLKSYAKKVPLSIQKLMVKKGKNHTWATPGPHSLFLAASSSAWLFHFWEQKDSKYKGLPANASWISFLARPGSVLAQRSTGCLIKVIAAAEYGFLGVLLQVVDSLHGRAYVCRPQRDDIFWSHIVDLEDWLEIEVEPFLTQGSRGAIGWKPTGQRFDLRASAMIFGHVVSHLQLRKLIEDLSGMPPKGNQSKEKLRHQFIDMVVPEEFLEKARGHVQKSRGKKKTDDETNYDTDLSEILSELGQQDGNAQDLKDFKEKKKHRMRKLLAEHKLADQPVVPKRRAKAKAKGRLSPRPSPSLDNYGDPS